jgi:hypothetical protein
MLLANRLVGRARVAGRGVDELSEDRRTVYR